MHTERLEGEERPASVVLAAADKELNEYFTTSLGVSAQAYEPAGGGGGGGSDSFLANAIMSDGHLRKEGRRTEDVEATLELVTARTRRVLDLVYYPRTAIWSASQLVPRWGHGNFLALGAETEAAVRGYLRSRKEGENGTAEFPIESAPVVGVFEWMRATVLEWLRSQSRPAKDVERRAQRVMLEQIITDCEILRRAALEEYEEYRRDRVARARTARAARKAALYAANEAYLASLLEQKKARYDARLSMRLARLARTRTAPAAP